MLKYLLTWGYGEGKCYTVEVESSRKQQMTKSRQRINRTRKCQEMLPRLTVKRKSKEITQGVWECLSIGRSLASLGISHQRVLDMHPNSKLPAVSKAYPQSSSQKVADVNMIPKSRIKAASKMHIRSASQNHASVQYLNARVSSRMHANFNGQLIVQCGSLPTTTKLKQRCAMVE